MKTFIKLLTISFLMIIYKAQVKSQNFAPVNAVWYYQDYRVDCLSSFYIKVESDRDTIIENKYVTILEVYNKTEYIPEGRLYIHEANNQVFFYEDNEFKLIYDFNLLAGDTALINIPNNRTHFDFSCSNGELDLNSNRSKIIVDSIDYLNVGGEELKMLYTSSIEADTLNDCFNFGTITERIGGLLGLCGWNCTQCLSGCTGHLRCYSDDEIFYHPVIEACDSGLNSAIKKLDEENIIFFPNPADTRIFISQIEGIEKYKVYSQLGNLVKEGEIRNASIELFDIPGGVYYLELIGEKNRSILTRKIVKE